MLLKTKKLILTLIIITLNKTNCFKFDQLKHS